ncbi:MAG TPA: gliding-motility protein MglA [bacterium]|nr:gliding-motility protein MglA [bacterium]
MFIHAALNEIHLKIVYYGPGLSGKTANLEYVYRHIDPSLKGDMISLTSREDRTIFFDFLQLEVGHIDGKKPKFNLYTVPGQIHYDLTRKIVLSGVDSIIFVADSQKARMEDNINTLLDLEKHLIQDGKTLEEFPWILQYNKRDLPDCETLDTLNHRLNFYNIPFFEAAATQGKGVFNTLKASIKEVVAHAHARLGETRRMRA